MADIKYQIVDPGDNKSINLIAGWYLSEWNIPEQNTIEKIKSFSADSTQCQVLMTLDNTPVATAGLYNHVGLLNREPRFKIYKNWLALVYTTPALRQKGYGALLCRHMEAAAKDLGLNDLYLFTHTAESLYTRLGWQQAERLSAGGKDIVVMRKEL